MKILYNRVLNNLTSLKKEIVKSVAHFSKKEYWLFWLLAFALFVSAFWMLQKINENFMITIPMAGGVVAEGVVGTPRFVNPILAVSNADQDLVALVYSGLMRKTENGTLSLDLASGYEVSKDGLVYTFTIKDEAFFHDGTPVTADDVVFTVNKIKDPVIPSFKKGSWDGINIEKINEKTVQFTLKQPYVPFLKNTTLGIMPLSVWKNSPIELNEANVKPLGSGPYKIQTVGKQGSGLIDYYELVPFKKFVLGKPYIEKIIMRFYPNEDAQIEALLKGEVDQVSSISPSNAKMLKAKNYRVESRALPRIFGLFFNQNQNQLFIDKNIIKAIELLIDRESIVRDVFMGFGLVIDTPIPLNMKKNQILNNDDDQYRQEKKVLEARAILEKNGWKLNPDGFLEKTTVEKKSDKGKTTSSDKKTALLEFSISTGNVKDLVQSAELIKQNLEAAGIKVDIKTFEIGNLNQNVIRPRKYDALFFGQIINQESDLFAFWHSSQRKDPGLNVALYTNTKTDKILEEVLVTSDETVRAKKYLEFEEEIRKDMPAVFLYSPEFIYIVSSNVKNFLLNNVTTPADRFLNVYLWHINNDNIWKIFAK